jgi:Flp pilus assembly protein TadG
MKQRRERGNSIIEFSLMTPWLIFLFIGAMDWGFYAYSLIATEAAARVGCMYASTSSTVLGASGTSNAVCTYVLEQLRKMPNVGSGVTTCSGSPVTVTVTALTSSTTPPSADGSSAAQVQVVYVTPVLLPMLGQLPSQLTITKTIQMRLRG